MLDIVVTWGGVGLLLVVIAELSSGEGGAALGGRHVIMRVTHFQDLLESPWALSSFSSLPDMLVTLPHLVAII